MYLTRTERIILDKIVREGEKTYYQLWMKDKAAKSNKTIQIALKSLQNKGLIKPTKKTKGNEKKPYVTTLRGLFQSILYTCPNLEDAQGIADRQRKLLPLIFGKWQHFKNHEVTDKQLSEMLQWLSYRLQYQEPLKLDHIMRYFSTYIFMITPLEERKSWLKAFHDDSDLKRWTLVEELYYASYIYQLHTMFNLLKQSKPNWDQGFHYIRLASMSPMTARTSKDRERLTRYLEQLENEKKE